MRISGIDAQLCSRCGECVQECPALLFEGSAGAVPSFDPERGRCIECGHCIAVCPTDAVRWDGSSDAAVARARDSSTFGELCFLLASRRSVRRYRDEPVAPREVEAILDAIRYAPSASNRRCWELIVITDRAVIRWLSAETIRLFRFARRVLTWGRFTPFLLSSGLRERAGDRRTINSIDRLVHDWREGRDRILFDAPCVVVLHVPEYGHQSGLDAGIAVTHAMLAAHARGLGTCWIGFVIELLLRRPRLARSLGIPKGRTAWGVFTLGYPAVRYHRAAPRAPVHMTGLR